MASRAWHQCPLRCLQRVLTPRQTAPQALLTLRTLGLIFREAQTLQGGPWEDKANAYLADAERALEGAMLLVSREFDTLTVDDQIDPSEAAQTTGEVTGQPTGYSWERS